MCLMKHFKYEFIIELFGGAYGRYFISISSKELALVSVYHAKVNKHDSLSYSGQIPLDPLEVQYPDMFIHVYEKHYKRKKYFN